MLKPIADQDRLHPIGAAFEAITGNRPSPPTIWRWKLEGCKGIRLPFVQVGGKPMISIRAAQQWLDDITAASQRAQCKVAKPSATRAARAAKQLSEIVA